MRDKLNDNPIAQVVLIGVLALVGIVMFMNSSGGGEESEESSAGGEVTVEATVEATVSGVEEEAAGATELPSSVPAPPPPAPVTTAYEAGKTVVLLVVHDGGIDDRLTAAATGSAAALPNTRLFVVPAKQVARYAAITIGLDLNRVPALVVMRPRKLSGSIPQATVDYGFQTPQSVVQAVRDASYHGPEATYHPN